MGTEIAPMLAVSDGNAAIAFYRTAFGATVLWHLDGGGHVVAGLSIDGAKFFLAHESPPHGTRGPASVRLHDRQDRAFRGRPGRSHTQALAAGAIERSPVTEHTYAMSGPSPIEADAPRLCRGSVRAHVACRKNPRVALSHATCATHATYDPLCRSSFNSVSTSRCAKTASGCSCRTVS